MKLNPDRVTKVVRECLFRDGEDSTVRVEVQGIMNQFGFHPGRLEEHREEIVSMLEELPDQFREELGGGWSFLKACMDRHGEQWGNHPDMELLFVLGIGIGRVRCVLPREQWNLFPGGMPYYVFTMKKEGETEDG